MIADFNPDDIGIANGNYFGLPCSLEEAEIVLLPVPWDATVSYGKGTADGPRAILDASLQVDLFDEKVKDVWKMKVGTVPVDAEVRRWSTETRKTVEKVISRLEEGVDESELQDETASVDVMSERVNSFVECCADQYLDAGKMVAVVGGEHSVPLGLLKALGKRYPDFGILHVDAHSDTRKAYEGFRYSHASIMYNTLEQVSSVSRLVQVGIRDFCGAENRLMHTHPAVRPFTDFQIRKDLFEGKSWMEICDRMIAALPEQVYISFDIDGLTPDCCPNTGTPVPGGLSFAEADYLLYRLAVSGRRIIGFDLCEVSPGESGEWDANVGSRILFKLLAYSCLNRKK